MKFFFILQLKSCCFCFFLLFSEAFRFILINFGDIFRTFVTDFDGVASILREKVKCLSTLMSLIFAGTKFRGN